MGILIGAVRSLADLADLHSVRSAVFEKELGLQLPGLRVRRGTSHLHLLARDGLNGPAVAALTVLETTGNLRWHERYELTFPLAGRSARYYGLAVLPDYRGLGLPLRMILAAQKLFIEPNAVRHTWLLFAAQRAVKSSFCRVLGYVPSRTTVMAEFGTCRVLTRDEQSDSALRVDQGAWAPPESTVQLTQHGQPSWSGAVAARKKEYISATPAA
jgi:GNAT superfamily N-acetyltransferase